MSGRRSDQGSRGSAELNPAQFVAALIDAAQVLYARGDTEAPRRCGVQLAVAADAGQLDVVVSVLAHRLDETFQSVWQRGWLPVDVYEFARRRADSDVVNFIVDGIAQESRRYPSAALDHRWRTQLDRIGAEIWWSRRTDLLSAWARRHVRGLAASAAAAVHALCLVHSLPRLPTPGSAHHYATAPRGGVDEKMLARVRALLAKAESTTFVEEAEALSAKAQELMTRYALERAIVDSDSRTTVEASARRLWIDPPYANAKSMLVAAVSRANRCKSAWSAELDLVTVVGDEVDLDIVELLVTSLLVQATRAMVSAGRQTGRFGQSRTRSYRQSFLLAYAERIGERLIEASASGHATVNGGQLVPVLAAREKAVDMAMASMFPKLGRRNVSGSNPAGWGAGRAAADIADLNSQRAVNG